jgi:glyoxylase-like metal-dependent hydrolase (beta-lactamase superfamily II)
MKIGHFEVEFLDDGLFLVDGGNLFGTMPRLWWEKRLPPDGNNCVLLRIRSLLVKGKNNILLIDTGVGEHAKEKYYRDMGIQPSKLNLLQNLEKRGIRPENVTDVINTHLHLTHCGWNLRQDSKKKTVCSFPNARYWIQKGEWETARFPSGFVKKRYNFSALKLLKDSHQIKWLEGDSEICPGISVQVTGGYTGCDQIVKINDTKNTLVVLSDFIPTSAHIQPEALSAFDLYPARTYELKMKFLEEAYRKKWLLAFPHDPSCSIGKLERNTKKEWDITCVQSDLLEQLIL